jgi:tRNA (guanine-N7-)-methyltransferase
MNTAEKLTQETTATTSHIILDVPADGTFKNLIEIFGNNNPLEIDLGCGKGRFLSARAASSPNINFLGIDKRLKYLKKAEKKIIHANLSNVRLLNVEASYALGYLLPPECASTIYIFFPDPWPKRRHHKRRLFTPAFINLLARVLVQKGKIHIATDWKEYMDEITALFNADNRFYPVPPFIPSEEERTNYEIIFCTKGVWIGRCSYEKL